MPRLHQVSRDETDARIVQVMYDLLFGDRDPTIEPGTATGTPGDWWPALQGFALYQSPSRELDPVLRELGQTRAGWAAGSQFVYSQHCKSLRGLGETEERIDAIRYWPAATCFTDTERLVLAYTDALVYDHGRVADEVVDALKGALGDTALLELTYITTLYLQHAVMSRALRTEFDDVDDRIVEVPGPDGVDAVSGLHIAPPTEG
jgi:alkylhydroperoxidase family enzyme